MRIIFINITYPNPFVQLSLSLSPPFHKLPDYFTFSATKDKDHNCKDWNRVLKEQKKISFPSAEMRIRKLSIYKDP